MLRRMAWNTFKNTGNINTMIELLEVNNLEEKNIESNAEININENENIKINMKNNNDY